MISLPTARPIGKSLTRVRRLRGLKQSHMAELLGISQSTISRIERGELVPEPYLYKRIAECISARLDPAGDAALKRLVETCSTPVHLVCDVTHRLLAASPARERMWGITAGELSGRSLWRYATEEIQRAEARLSEIGWGDLHGTSQISFKTTANFSDDLKIWPQTLIWDRIVLADGSAARLDYMG